MRGAEGIGARDRPAPEAPRLAVCVVTHDSRADLPGCLAAVAALTTRPLELVVVDCASRDGTLETAANGVWRAPSGVRFEAVALTENRGFAGGMNEAIARTTAPWVLSLNPDARPAPDYAERLIARAGDGARRGLAVGAVTGRLVRLGPARGPGEPPGATGSAGQGPRLLDACGMRLALTWRHLDRGSGLPDEGQYPVAERVFGATGAASLFAREALEDVAVGGEVFDAAFHSFREDAELAFRLRERGWEVLYEPGARCRHRRFNLPGRRRAMPASVNLHSLKNRYLLRAYHQTGWNFVWTLPATLFRDLLALGHVVVRERASRGADRRRWAHRREIHARRRAIQGRRTVPAQRIDRWFLTRGLPLPHEAPAD